MRAFSLSLGLLAIALLPVSAQVTVEITQEQDQFLPGETLTTAVRITNRSGQSLSLGEDKDWLVFAVQGHGSEVVPKIGDVPVIEAFTLESSKVATKRVDLAPYFSFARSGHYSVSATVRIKEWNREITSQPKDFDIVDGAKLWEQDVGVPTAGGFTNVMPEVRKFILQQANYLNKQIRLYVRLTDAAGGVTFRVIPVGPTVSFDRPAPQVDKFSNLHLLHQEGAHLFGYIVISPQGEIIARRTYDYTDKRPRLEPDVDGKILVQGGIRRPTPKDIPPSKPESPDKDTPKPLRAPGEMMPPDF